MLKTIPLGLALLVAAPLAAQQMGSVNAKAPTCTQSIKFADGNEVQLQYKAITWAEGKFMDAAAAATDRGESMRQRINKTAAARPLGSVKSTADLKMSGRAIAAGEYDLYFTVQAREGNLMWLANLRPKGKQDAEPLRWRLALEKSETATPRLIIALHGGEKDTDAGVYLAFGNQNCMVNLSCAETGDDKDADRDADK